jgi:hypothetical protein
MTSLHDTIKERSRLARLRLGQEVGEYVDLPSMSQGDEKVRVMLVPLTEAELQRGLAYAAMDEDVPESFSGVQYRSRRAVLSDLWHATRDPGQPEKRLFESVDEMASLLDPSDVDYLNMHLATLMNYASPSLDGMTEADLDFLDRAWQQIKPSELSGRRWAAAKVSLSILLPELLQARSFGTTSISGSTTTNENVESTSDVLAS